MMGAASETLRFRSREKQTSLLAGEDQDHTGWKIILIYIHIWKIMFSMLKWFLPPESQLSFHRKLLRWPTLGVGAYLGIL